MAILWESVGNPMGIIWGFPVGFYGNPMGIPTEILWEWDGNENLNSIPTATMATDQLFAKLTEGLVSSTTNFGN